MSDFRMVKIKRAASGAGDYKVSAHILQPANAPERKKFPFDEANKKQTKPI